MTMTPESKDQNENTVAMLFKSLANQVRLIGLGVIAKVQQEGIKLIDSLLKEGEKFENLNKPPDDRTGVADKSQVDLANVEKIFEDRVCRALQRLDIPTQEDLRKLHRQVEDLNQKIKTLSGNK